MQAAKYNDISLGSGNESSYTDSMHFSFTVLANPEQEPHSQKQLAHWAVDVIIETGAWIILGEGTTTNQ